MRDHDSDLARRAGTEVEVPSEPMRTLLVALHAATSRLTFAYAHRPFWILLKLPVAVRAHGRARRVAERGRVVDLRREG